MGQLSTDLTDLANQFYPDFIKLISQALKINEHTINLNRSLSEFSIDSINIVQLTTLLNETYHLSITPNSLFEYFTLAEFFNGLLDKYHEVLSSYYSLMPSTLKPSVVERVAPLPRAGTSTAGCRKRQDPFDLQQPIAIIGISGIFPGAADLDTFWNNLMLGKNAIGEVPKDRWNWEAYDNHSSSKWGGFVEEMMCFDADFFNISPREAELTDPQQRVFLQIVWKAIEDAGYTPADLTRVSTGVFVGVFGHDYAEILQQNNVVDAYVTTGITHSVLANRVSYLLNLHGPSVAIDTACSSSLVAIHQAVQAIQNGDCAVAIAGGVNALLSPTTYLAANKAGMLSEDGACKTFDSKANGYVRGEGAAAILLKPLLAAKADGDHIYGVIKGTAVNHGGHVNSLTAPNPNAQAEVIMSACRRAEITPDAIRYIETHGTGTTLGDPIEINGLKKAFANLAEENNQLSTHYYCGLGSVKTHIGHLEAAAGIMGVIKILLAMQHKQIPANLHFKELNPYINLAESPFYIVNTIESFTNLLDSQGKKIPLCAGVSSFGFGGTNAHIIIEEVSQTNMAELPGKTSYLFALSAKTNLALQQKISDLYQWVNNKQSKSISLAAISYTLNLGRVHFSQRCAFVVDSLEELQATLGKILQKQEADNFLINTESKNKLIHSAIFQQLFKQLIEELTGEHKSDFRDKLLALGSFYVEGYEVDWNRLYAHETKQRISLPTYPFAKEYYGLSVISAVTSAPFSPSLRGSEAAVAIQEFSWIASPASQVRNDGENGELGSPTTLTAIDAVQQNFKQFIAKLLKKPIASIEITASLNELGLDSITLKELSVELESYYGIKLNPSLFFTYQTIQALSNYLLKIYPQEMTRVSREAVIASTRSVRGNPGVFNLSSGSSSLPTQLNQQRQGPFDEQPKLIAIIGMQALLPQSKDVNAFWEHLEAGHDLITEVPPERWDWQKYYGDSTQNEAKTNSKWGGFLTEIDKFDAAFFNISPREASLMDPQHRLFMEVVWKTIEDAGYDPFSLANETVGLFVGVEFNEYQTVISSQKKIFHGYVATGNSHAILANRISYFLNLRGPSEVIHTACASSLTAINRAAQALRNGECSIAIAGGVSLMLDPQTFVITSQLGVLSPDGRCKTFDKTANGYVKGEGIAAVLLKPLEKAQIDKDHIYGVIKGIAVSHGGKAQSLTAPNAEAQSQLIVKTYTQANVDPETITYIETHGTGTELGDPVEVEGLKLAFDKLSVTKKNYCGLGAVKTNMGHLEPASGIASVIKILLAMKYEKIPANLHFHELNSYIDFTQTPFYLLEKLQIWHRLKDGNGNEIPRRAGVSAFGFGGSMAHVLIEEAPLVQANISTEKLKPYYLITLSAKQKESLIQKIVDLHNWLTKHLHNTNLADLSFTLNLGRSHFELRCALVVSSLSELCDLLLKAKQYFSIYPTAEIGIFGKAGDYFNKQQLLSQAELYVKHHVIDWDLLYQGDTRQRVAGLPFYPFVKSRYWIESAESEPVEHLIPIIPSTSLPDFTLTYLKQIFADKVNLLPQQIATDTTYEIYGVDSLLSLEIIERLEQDFGTLPKTLLYEKNKLSDLAGYLQKNFAEKLIALQAFTISPLQTLKDLSCQRRLASSQTIANSAEYLDASLRWHDKMCAPENDFSQYIQSQQPIAIIGLSGTYPMAKNIDEFWLNLTEGRDCITEVPLDRWDYKNYPVLINGEKIYYKYGGFIADVDKFDPLFFNISPREATLIDPQERLFLQSAWTTIEDAGYTREKLQKTVANRVGVFAGVTYNFYPLLIAEEWSKGNQLPLDIQTFSIANRVSYFLNLVGPSLVIDTACSSSLSAIHLACESIANGECTMAIAGGVNLSLHPCKYHFLGSYGFMSTQGQCASFAKEGTGYVPAEGVGSILLKPLSLALEDNDRIYAVIKGSSMNHGGKTSGYTVPNPNAQATLIKEALEKAQVDARSISYIEAHGTGTALGDPIEISGLQEAFATYTQDKQFCAIGSVKSNIGHLESAAGISQLTKVLLQMRHKKLVPSLHAEELNPYIDFANTPFFVQRELSDWQVDQYHLRRAGISSFGAGGTNVHLIVEEFQPECSRENNNKIVSDNSMLFLLSAANKERLHQYAKNMHDFLVRESSHYANEYALNEWLKNVCYTSQVGRESMVARLAIVIENYHDLIENLATYIQSTDQTTQQLWVNHDAKVYEVTEFSAEELVTLIQQNQQQKLAELWIGGAKLPWQQTDRILFYKRVFLPTYPFEQRRCWVSSEPEAIQKIVSRLPPLASSESFAMTASREETDLVHQQVIEIFAKSLALNIEEINPTTLFHDYGLDSIIGIYFVNELSKLFPDTITPMDLYRYSTVQKLAEYIMQKQPLLPLSFPASGKNEREEIKPNITQPIAIVGLSCRFPEANNKEAYWQLLSNGKDAVASMPEQRWELLKGTREALLRDKTSHYWGSYLPDIEAFDAYFFGISPREATFMEPEQRGLLEVAYEAIEDAGLSVEALAGSNTGVFLGLDAGQFAHLQKLEGDVDALYLATGNATSIAANRISYLFDLHGPSMVVDTACSASLVALHLACLNLQNQLCDLAIVGGANINLLPSIHLILSKAKMFSLDGKCKTFSADAAGYAPGEGIGIVVLKPLDKAIQDKDRVYAVIAGSAVNQDGKTNGLTAPNGLQQEALLKQVYMEAKIQPEWLSYVECHGTGTFLGDPIEVQALGEAISKNRTAENPCWIASVKTNIGHLEPAAGIASLIKVALALEQKKIPPHLHFATPNPHIAFAKYHFQVPSLLQPWPKYGAFRVAGVSSFGFGGTNAHAILRELSVEEQQAIIQKNEQPNTAELFTLSAKDMEALKILLERYCAYLAGNLSLNLAALCYNVHLRRTHYHARLAIIAHTTAELYDSLCLLRKDLSANAENIFLSQATTTPGLNQSKFNQNKIVATNLVILATQYVNQQNIDWQQYESNRSYPYQDMPLYPWQHKRYWPNFTDTITQPENNSLDSLTMHPLRRAAACPRHPDCEVDAVDNTANKSWQRHVGNGYGASSYLDSYPLQGAQIFSPLSAKQFVFKFSTKWLPEIPDTYHIIHVGYYLDMLAFAIKELYQQAQFTVQDLVFLSPLMVPDNVVVQVQLVLQALEDDGMSFSFYSNTANQTNWTEHAKGRVLSTAYSDKKIDPVSVIKQRCSVMQDGTLFYQRLTSMGLPVGNSIRWTQKYWLGENEILCEFHPPEVTNKGDQFVLNVHPGIIDASIQSLFPLLPKELTKPFIADGIKIIHCNYLKDDQLYLLALLKTIDSEHKKITGDWSLINQDGEVIIECQQISLTQIDSKIDINKIMHAQEQEHLDLSGLSRQEAEQKAIEYLTEQIAIIFSMPKQDIDIYRSLQQMGMDSLMALVLVRVIEVGFGMAYSVQDILQGASITEIVNAALNQREDMFTDRCESSNISGESVIFTGLPRLASGSVAITLPRNDGENKSWISYRQKQPQAKTRLFCFPYGGGGASIYRDWQQNLPDDIEVCPIQLPGREERVGEQPIIHIDALIDNLIKHLQSEFDLPFAIFGHSFGSLIAFAMSRRLRQLGLPLPIHLFVSAYPDPRIPSKGLDNLLQQLKTIGLELFDLDNLSITQLSDQNLIQLAAIFNENGVFEYGRHLISPEIMRLLLPIFIGDMQIVKSYIYQDETPFDIPISVFLGQKDTWIPYVDHLGWAAHTRKSCQIYEFNSGHLFIKDNGCKKEMLNTITKALRVVAEMIVC